MPSFDDTTLNPLVKAWHGKIELAMSVKKARFQEDADECFRFFNGPHKFLWDPKYLRGSKGFALAGDGDETPEPSFKMTINRVAELVQLFGPYLYHRNPIRQVNPRKPPGPPIELFGDPQNPMVQAYYLQLTEPVRQERAQDQARAKILEFYQNYTPNACDLKTESRRSIDEALIKGMGVLWTELYTPPGSNVRMVSSFYDTVDNLALDPDMETIDGATWCARRCVHPVWQVEDDYHWPRGSLKGNMESYASQGASEGDEEGDYNRKRGLTNDLLCYWKIWSKMGMGGLLSGMGSTGSMGGATGPSTPTPAMGAEIARLGQEFERFGPYVHLVAAEGCPYFLNLPPNMPGDDASIAQAIQWPTPFWADGTWPFTPIIFHEVPRQVWPMSHLKPGLGELKFLNWAYSFITAKIKTVSRDFIAVLKSASEEIKSTIQNGRDLTIIELEGEFPEIGKVVQFLQHPSFNGEVWKVIQAVETNFEKRIGLNELIYGSSGKQMRSAEEAQIKGQQIQVRPDDMATKVEEAMTSIARKEAIAARWHLKPEDVLPVMGPMGSQMWAQYVMSSDLTEIVQQMEYRIEAGSARKPNKDRDAANMKEALQFLFQPLLQLAMASGDFTAINKLITDWAKSIDLDPEGYLLKPSPPPMPPQPGQPPPGQPPGNPQPQPRAA